MLNKLLRHFKQFCELGAAFFSNTQDENKFFTGNYLNAKYEEKVRQYN